MINMMEDMLYNTPYSLCGFCRCTIPERREARWVDTGADWKQISCVACAAKHPEDKVSDVEVPDEVCRIIQLDEEIRVLDEKISRAKTERLENIRAILNQEGYVPGMTVYFRETKYVVTGMKLDRNGVAPSVRIVVHPAKKDGTASKQNESTISWTDFIRLWRMQRADPDAYIKACEAHREVCKKRREERIRDDQL